MTTMYVVVTNPEMKLLLGIVILWKLCRIRPSWICNDVNEVGIISGATSEGNIRNHSNRPK